MAQERTDQVFLMIQILMQINEFTKEFVNFVREGGFPLLVSHIFTNNSVISQQISMTFSGIVGHGTSKK